MTTNNTLVERNGHAQNNRVAEFAPPPAPPSVGEALSLSVADTVESAMSAVHDDMAVANRRRQLEASKRRLAAINADFKRMVDELNANYSKDQAILVELYVEGCREDILRCYLSVNSALATTQEGRAKIEQLVDQLIANTIKQIQAPEPEKEPAGQPQREPQGEPIESPLPADPGDGGEEPRGRSRGKKGK